MLSTSTSDGIVFAAALYPRRQIDRGAGDRERSEPRRFARPRIEIEHRDLAQTVQPIPNLWSRTPRPPDTDRQCPPDRPGVISALSNSATGQRGMICALPTRPAGNRKCKFSRLRRHYPRLLQHRIREHETPSSPAETDGCTRIRTAAFFFEEPIQTIHLRSSRTARVLRLDAHRAANCAINRQPIPPATVPLSSPERRAGFTVTITGIFTSQ